MSWPGGSEDLAEPLLLTLPSQVRSQVSEVCQAWEESPACLALVAFQVWLRVSVECLVCQPFQVSLDGEPSSPET